MALPHELADQYGTLRRKIAELDATAGEDGDRVLVELIFWFGSEFNKLAGGA